MNSVLQCNLHRLFCAALLQLYDEHAVAQLREVYCLAACSKLLGAYLLSEGVVDSHVSCSVVSEEELCGASHTVGSDAEHLFACFRVLDACGVERHLQTCESVNLACAPAVAVRLLGCACIVVVACGLVQNSAHEPARGSG